MKSQPNALLLKEPESEGDDVEPNVAWVAVGPCGLLSLEVCSLDSSVSRESVK